MLFDLVRFFRTAQHPYRAEYMLDLSQYDFGGFRVDEPAQVVFTAQVEGERVFAELEVHAAVSGLCARCLEPVQESHKVKSEYLLKEDEILCDEPELPIGPKGVLDVDELAFQELMLNIPQVLLCSTDCPGLCPVCGKKKAAGHSCQAAENPAPADPRLSILKQLLN